LRDKVCHHLSGGEKRKVALAGALVLSPELLVLDEPFEGLDPASRSDLVALLNRLHQEHGVTLVIATHDVNVVPAVADMVYVLLPAPERSGAAEPPARAKRAEEPAPAAPAAEPLGRTRGAEPS